MARTNIPLDTLTRETAVELTNKVTIDAALVLAGAKIAYAKGDSLIIEIYNAENAEKDLTIKASTAQNAFKKCLGDKVYPIAATKTKMIFGVDQTRFKNADGYIYIDFEAGFTGTIAAIIVPW